jgi:branched-chain amino acid aminotransferase
VKNKESGMALKKTDWIWRNGEWVAWDDATVHVSTHALHYGSSVFEGIRAYATPHGPALFRLEPHVERLYRSCKIARIDLPFAYDVVSQAMVDIVARNHHDSCYIRPLVFRGSGALGVDGRACPSEIIILTMEWGRYLGAEAIEQGVNVMVSSWRRMAPDTFAPLAKIGGQYINSQFVAMEARDNGYDEGICLDVNGYVCEGSGENIFMVQNGIIYTPPLAASVLGGVTRDCVFKIAQMLGYEVRQEMISREMLYTADELFLTGTAAEISPVRSVDKLEVGCGSRGPITKAIQEQFFGMTSGQLPDRFGWLTPVYAEANVSRELTRSFEGR